MATENSESHPSISEATRLPKILDQKSISSLKNPNGKVTFFDTLLATLSNRRGQRHGDKRRASEAAITSKQIRHKSEFVEKAKSTSDIPSIEAKRLKARENWNAIGATTANYNSNIMKLIMAKNSARCVQIALRFSLRFFVCCISKVSIKPHQTILQSNLMNGRGLE